MEEQFMLRVTAAVSEMIERLLNDGGTGTFIIGYDHFSASLLDLPCVVEEHGLNLPMRDALRRRFHREPDLNPEVVRHVEGDFQIIMAGGTAENEDGDENACNASKKEVATPSTKPCA
ncbi:hypothetical protein Pfo_018550 [Paulownia fortunei]|nr:hypothetical protein Pfo_018550 [Paulownia fortunei]